MKALRFLISWLACVALCANPCYGATVINSYRFAAAGGGAPSPAILWVKANEGSGTTVAAAVGTGSTNFNGTWNAAGSGSSLQFNGTTHRMASSAAINYASNQIISVSFWIKAASFSTATTQIWFESTANFSGVSNNAWCIQNDPDGDYAKILVQWLDNASNAVIKSVARPSTGTWHNFVFVLNNSTGAVLCWLDGVSQTVTTEFSAWASAGAWTTAILYYGARNNGSLWAPIQLDDIQIHAGALTITDAVAITAAGQQ